MHRIYEIKEIWNKIKYKKIIIGIIALFGIFFLLFSWRVRNITVIGNRWYTEDQVKEMIFTDDISRSVPYILWNSKIGNRKNLPFIQDYSIDVTDLFDIEVIVYEKSIVGYVPYMSSYMYFDKDGIVVESSSQKLPGIPGIFDLKFGNIVLYQALPVEDEEVFSQILTITQILSVYEIEADNIRIVQKHITLTVGDIEVILGGFTDINGKLSELRDILVELHGLQGTLYLDSYEENKDRTLYIFKRK